MPSRTHRLALATAAATWLLLLVGGLVHGTGSGLACPDWPTCYGSLFPRMAGGVLYEHSHRLFASAVGLLTVALAVALARGGRARLGALAVALVVAQGVLGGLTVIWKLPDLVSTAHLAVSLLFFATVLWAAWSTRERVLAVVPPAARRLAGLAAAAVYAQAVLGALVRHTESGLACSGWVLCGGSLWPDAHPSMRLHMAHRLGGVAVAALVVAAAVAAWRIRPRAARALVALVAAQIVLGFASVRTGLALWAVQAHLGVAAALWASSLSLAWSMRAGAREAAPLRRVAEVRA